LAPFPDCRRASGGNPTVGRTVLVRKRGTYEGNCLRLMGWRPTRPNLAIHSWTPRGSLGRGCQPRRSPPYLGRLGIPAMLWARNVTHDAKMVYLSHTGCYRSRDRSRERSLLVWVPNIRLDRLVYPTVPGGGGPRRDVDEAGPRGNGMVEEVPGTLSARNPRSASGRCIPLNGCLVLINCVNGR
jgi:hypothetical protein